MREVPEPAQIFFRWRMLHSSHPFIDEDSHPRDCAYDYDWHDFLSGRPVLSDQLSVADVAAMLNVSPRYVLRLIAEGRLRANTGPDGTRSIPRANAEKYLAQAKAKSRKALEELGRVSQEADAYKKQE
jgi:excisionase family DNA binding protein